MVAAATDSIAHGAASDGTHNRPRAGFLLLNCYLLSVTDLAWNANLLNDRRGRNHTPDILSQAQAA